MANEMSASNVKEAAKKGEGKRKPSLTARQCTFVLAYAQTHSETEAALIAGYSPKNPGQSGHQALKSIAKKMPDFMDDLGLSIKVIIEKHLTPLLNAWTKKFAMKDGKFTDSVDIPDNATRLLALDAAFRLHGAYPAKGEAAKDVTGMRVVVLDENDQAS
jgi:Terminase small subunit